MRPKPCQTKEAAVSHHWMVAQYYLLWRMHNERKGIRSFLILTQSSSVHVPCRLTTFLNYIFLGNTLTSKSKGCSVVRALASNQYGRGSDPHVNAIHMWVGLFLVLSFAPREFFHAWVPVSLSPQEPTFPNLISRQWEPQRGSSAINTTWSNAQIQDIFNSYSLSPNGLLVNSPWGQRANGLLTQRPWNNYCFRP